MHQVRFGAAGGCSCRGTTSVTYITYIEESHSHSPSDLACESVCLAFQVLKDDILAATQHLFTDRHAAHNGQPCIHNATQYAALCMEALAAVGLQTHSDTAASEYLRLFALFALHHTCLLAGLSLSVSLAVPGDCFSQVVHRMHRMHHMHHMRHMCHIHRRPLTFDEFFERISAKTSELIQPKLHELQCAVTMHRGVAMTMQGGRPQTARAAMNPISHGSDTDLTPIRQ